MLQKEEVWRLLQPENFFRTCLGPQVYGKALRWPGFRWNWANCYGVHASVAQFLHDLCEEYHIHLFFWFVGNNNGRKKRPQYTQARLNQRASTKEENSNTCCVTKEKVGHYWVVLICSCCFWMKICHQTCAACCGRLCAVFILLMSANKKSTKNHILFLDKIFKSKKNSAMLTKIVTLAQKFLRQELIKYTARFPIAKPPF